MKQDSAEDLMGKAVENFEPNPRPGASIARVRGQLCVWHQFLIDGVGNVRLPVIGGASDEDSSEKDEGYDRGHGEWRNRTAKARLRGSALATRC